MYRHSVNISHTSFEQQIENSYEEPFPPTTSLPSIPSFGSNEEWRQFRSHAFADPSTTSASPNSLYFPGIGRSSPSAGITNSTTPLSSTSLDISKTTVPLLLEPSQGLSFEAKAPKHTKFILEAPMVTKNKKDKAMRSCTLCYTRKLECSESKITNRCIHCFSNSSYCKGPIETPQLMDLELFHQKVARLFTNYHLFRGSKPTALGPIQLKLSLRPSYDHAVPSNAWTYRLEIPELPEDFRFKWDYSKNLGDVLDAVLPGDIPSPPPRQPGSYDLSSYDSLCRLFCACISLLRQPDRCTVDSFYEFPQSSLHVVIGVLNQLCCTASQIFTELFEHVRGCCYANRDQRRTPGLMYNLAENIGLMCKEIRCLIDAGQRWTNSYPHRQLLMNAAQTLEDLRNLGRGLCAKAFDSANESAALVCARIHITPCLIAASGVLSGQNSPLNQTTSFSDIFGDSRFQTAGTLPVTLANSDQDLPMSLTVDHCGQATEVTESYPIGANEWQSDLVSHEDLLIQDQIPCGLLGFQAEADAMLDLNWTVEIDDYTAARDTERSHCSAFGAIDSPHAGAVDHIALTDPALWEQQVVDPDFHIPIPEYSNAECNMSTSLQDMMGIQQNDSNHTQQLVHTDKPGTFAMPDQHSETTASIIDDLEHSQRPSKRKQLKSLLSRKRRRFTPSGLGRSEAPSTPRTDTSLNNGQSMEPAAEIASLARKRAILGSTSNENLRRTLRTDWVSAWEGRASSRESTFESRHAVRDVNISDVNRRPLSWPRRHALRKSLDISVAVLTKGFENLIKEQGDTSM